MIVVLCGGVGGSRFLRALTSVVDPERVTAVVNTGDDDWFHGLYVSPDPDIITYALAGEVDEARGWGLRDDTFQWVASVKRFGRETWFQIGDRDLATHLHRTRLLNEGWRLSRVMGNIADAFGVRVKLLPMSDDRVRTLVQTDSGELSFQGFLVKRRAADTVRSVRYDGAAQAEPARGVLDAIRDAEAIFMAPSNPIGSIAPILAIHEIREAVAGAKCARIAVSPIIGGRSLQPPAAEMMAGIGHDVSVAGVARIYAGLVDTLIIDEVDADLAAQVRAAGAEPIVAATVMRDGATSTALARAALSAAGIGA